MDGYTTFDNVRVRGTLLAEGGMGLEEDTYEVTAADATAAAGSAPTKAEYDALVTLANQLKSKYNTLLGVLAGGAE